MKQHVIDYLASLELLKRAYASNSLYMADLLIESAERLTPELDGEYHKSRVREIWLAREFENRCNLFGK